MSKPVKLSAPLYAVPDGAIYPRWFEAGETVTGELAQAAHDQGKVAGARRKSAPARKAAGAAPENK